MTKPLGATRLTLLPLVAATYFIVSGGPYGLEDLVAGAGFDRALLILLLTPLFWSLPTALMVGELSSAIPEEGGYYAWVRRGLGPFWGFQEAWLSLAASIFDMAIYPTLFVAYLGRVAPQLSEGWPALAAGAAMVAACVAWNLRGAGAVGRGSVALGVALLAPFAVLAVLGALSTPAAASPPPAPAGGMLAGVFVAMWNYMGWDNASTFAGEVERPQRTYPLAILATVGLVTLTYALPVLGARMAGLDAHAWTTGSWVTAAESLGGRSLGLAVVAGGMISAMGMFNALVLSYSRLPMALAEDGFLPRALALRGGNGVPWVAVLACGVAYVACLGLGFERLVELDVVVYGGSLVLEFAALVALRLREPALPRPFRVPGGLAGAVLVGVPPLALLAVALLAGDGDADQARTGHVLGLALILTGPAVYAILPRRSAQVAPVTRTRASR